MREKIKNTILDIAKREGIKIDKIILFGSRARGEASEDSDWDILIVIDKAIEKNKRREFWYYFYSELRNKIPDHSFDIIIKDKKSYETEITIVNTIANEAFTEGMKL